MQLISNNLEYILAAKDLIGKVTPPSGFVTETDPNIAVKKVFDMMWLAAMVLAVFFIIWGGLKFISSRGEPGKIKEAQDTILYAVLGLVIAIVAGLIANLIYKRITGQDLKDLPKAFVPIYMSVPKGS